jgi:DNA-binding HxlR family transcriptional regulator
VETSSTRYHGRVSKAAPHDPVHCDAALTSVFGLLGKRWTGVIIGALLERPARFAEMAAAIPGISEAMLSSRLAELQAVGLVSREVLPGPPIASMYRLTDRGAALRPGLEALANWAEAHWLHREADPGIRASATATWRTS